MLISWRVSWTDTDVKSQEDLPGNFTERLEVCAPSCISVSLTSESVTLIIGVILCSASVFIFAVLTQSFCSLLTLVGEKYMKYTLCRTRDKIFINIKTSRAENTHSQSHINMDNTRAL